MLIRRLTKGLKPSFDPDCPRARIPRAMVGHGGGGGGRGAGGQGGHGGGLSCLDTGWTLESGL